MGAGPAGEPAAESGLPEAGEAAILEERGRDYKRDEKGRSKSDYEARALALCESAVGGNILGHADKNGFVIRYDRKTNDFAKGHPLKGVSTMFKPTQGETYYKEQRERDLEHGGTA